MSSRVMPYGRLKLQMLKKQLQGINEKKYLDVYSPANDMTMNVGTVACINQVAEGTDFNNRIGRKVAPKYLEYDLTITTTTATQPTVPTMGIVHFVWDKQPNTGLPSYNTIFDTTVITATWSSFKNLSGFGERFRILKSHPTEWSGSSNYSEPLRIRGFLNLEPVSQNCEYNSSAAAVPSAGSLLIAYSSNEAVASGLQLYYATRFAYTDM